MPQKLKMQEWKSNWNWLLALTIGWKTIFIFFLKERQGKVSQGKARKGKVRWGKEKWGKSRKGKEREKEKAELS